MNKLLIKLGLKKPDDKIDKFEQRNKLSITTKDGFNKEWTYSGNNKSLIYPWKSFYKWYFGRGKSETFIFISLQGQEMIRRDNIAGFSVGHYQHKLS